MGSEGSWIGREGQGMGECGAGDWGLRGREWEGERQGMGSEQKEMVVERQLGIEGQWMGSEGQGM